MTLSLKKIFLMLVSGRLYTICTPTHAHVCTCAKTEQLVCRNLDDIKNFAAPQKIGDETSIF